MSLNIEQKKAVVGEVTQVLSVAQAAVLAEYRGLTVAQITELRGAARSAPAWTCVSREKHTGEALCGGIEL